MIIDTIQEWFREVLIDGIISNLSGTFDTVNTKVAEIAGEVGMTPSGWNGGIFNMIRSLSETVIVPIAGIILTFVMCYELIQLIVEKNNLHDFDTWLFWKWIFKTFCVVLIVTNTWNIIMAVFDVAQSVVDQSAGVIISDAGIDISGVVGDLETTLADWSIGSLLGLWFQSVFVGLCSHISAIVFWMWKQSGSLRGYKRISPASIRRSAGCTVGGASRTARVSRASICWKVPSAGHTWHRMIRTAARTTTERIYVGACS